MDCLGICFLPIINSNVWSDLLIMIKEMGEMYQAITGRDASGLFTAAERAYQVERCFNALVGITRKDDARQGTTRGEKDPVNLPGMLDEYYLYRGCSPDGRDMLQCAALLPELKRQGYHITVMTTPKGQDVLANDPHIDDWFLQDSGQVPNHELTDFWRVIERKYDRFINLSESIEGTLLAMPGRASHAWPHAVRHRNLDKNYGEWTANIADLPFKPEGKFYPTDDERQDATVYLEQTRFAASS